MASRSALKTRRQLGLRKRVLVLRGPLLVVPMLSICVAVPASAGRLEVNAAARFSGEYGLEATIAPCLQSELSIGPSPPISGTFIGCRSITAHEVQASAPATTFKAGTTIRLDNGFSVQANATFSAFLHSLIDSPFAFVTDGSPAESVSYSAHFHTNLDNLALGATDLLDHLVGYDDSGDVLFRLSFKRHVPLNENRLVLAARLDDGTYSETLWGEEVLVPSGYNEFAVRWRAAAGTGELVVALNQADPGGTVPSVGLTLLGNGAARLAFVRWGAVGGAVDATSGSLYLDDFSSLP